ncbi:xaa-Pro aminopeptidase ApepP-like [Periplaneta americana]|uniref:xaa-Pro aminopeptidase ApepP-like n=1 Tax=Periplaneta americana TaxID=6978 RepID=UPI0037E891B5
MLRVICVLVLVGLAASKTAPPVGGTELRHSRDTRALFRRNVCSSEDPAPLGRVDTTERLRQLRERMVEANVSAYIITSQDEHQSEYVSSHDQRRAYISGFSGSAGDAVVTLHSAALWTDSRYYLQAENQLDCNWLLMKSGFKEVPKIEEWLAMQLPSGDVISADPKIIPYTDWILWDEYFTKRNLRLEPLYDNLVDMIWGAAEGRPPYPSDPIFVLDTKYTGLSWQDKISAVRQTMAEKGFNVLVLTALDEIAWLFNLRGSDVPFTPVFQSYAVVEMSGATLYLSPGKSTPQVEEHLNAHSSNMDDSVRIKNYTDIWNDLAELKDDAVRVWLPYPFSYARGVSYLVYKQIPIGKTGFATSPVLLMKDVKNDVEAVGMHNAHVRDAVALCQLLQMLETGVAAGEIWDELAVVEKLKQLRIKQALSLGPSFGTISAFGPNAALPHYEPEPVTNRVIDDTSLFMLDSGGQYLDGTTDVTRTIHLGTPTEAQREIYTSLLMGCIDIVSTTFPEGQTLQTMEILIRRPLFSLGLNYGHGSTHGIGSCLAVHEAFNTTYHINFFGSQEPGYYQDNEFGIRLENIVTVVQANTTLGTDPNYLTFKPVTLVPYEHNLINPDIMSKTQIKWLNDYHTMVREVVGEEMLRQGLNETYLWLLYKTQPILL